MPIANRRLHGRRYKSALRRIPPHDLHRMTKHKSLDKANAIEWTEINSMNAKSFFLLAFAICLAARVIAAEILPLAGEWRFALDRANVGHE